MGQLFQEKEDLISVIQTECLLCIVQHGHDKLNNGYIKKGEGQWPSADMKQYCRRTGCLVVGVGCKGSENEQLEWRISTTLAERCLMLNMNITQIRCYVLIKMIVKTFINPVFKDVISSYMCKTVLFHCNVQTQPNIWRENNLLCCLSLCLSLLRRNIMNENCSHFIISGNNLMRGKISPAVKSGILKILNDIMNSQGRALHAIQCDDIGSRVQHKSGIICRFKKVDIRLASTCLSLQKFFIKNISDFASTFKSQKETCCTKVEALYFIVNQLSFWRVGQDSLPSSGRMVGWYCVTLGSILASSNIRQYNTVSTDALTFMLLGRNTDVASSKLKHVSILYSVQDIHNAESFLREIERDYNLHIVQPVCDCYTICGILVKEEFIAICDIHNEEVMQFATATCVRFLPCAPKELRYEMFRSTEEERMLRKDDDDCMDCAVVDSLTYLFFLQYKVYSNLRRDNEKQAALSKLLMTINEEIKLGNRDSDLGHREPDIGYRETALNLLGKCFEQDGRAEDAL